MGNPDELDITFIIFFSEW